MLLTRTPYYGLSQLEDPLNSDILPEQYIIFPREDMTKEEIDRTDIELRKIVGEQVKIEKDYGCYGDLLIWTIRLEAQQVDEVGRLSGVGTLP